MKNLKFITVMLTILFLTSAGAGLGFAAEDNKDAKSSQEGNQQQSESHEDPAHHEDIDSGRDFGQHVRDHNDHFSGEHNPGKHQGFSTLRD